MKLFRIIFVASFYLTMSFTQKYIRIPPSIIKGPPKHLIYRLGHRIRLDCKGKGEPAVKYEWKKNGIILNQNLHNIQKGADGTITIQPATSADEGYYQCFAGNQYGTALSNTTHLERAYFGSAPETPVVHNLTFREGQHHFMKCDPRRSFPKETYIWEIFNSTNDRHPMTLRLTERLQVAENGDLHFAYVRQEDDLGGRLYRCSTYNPFLRVKLGGNYTKLTVISHEISPFGLSVGFISKTPTVAVTGRNVTLTCFFYGNPAPTIYWLRPDRRSYSIGNYTLSASNTRITIENITVWDEGRFVCRATSPRGEQSREINMTVEVEPVFKNFNDAPYDVNVTEGESFTFNCNPVAKPAAKIVWLQDGKELDPSNPPERFMFSNNNRSLTIRDVCRDCVDPLGRQTDLMVIQCNASNVHGYAFAQGYLNVPNYCGYELDYKNSILWNLTSAGNEISRPCPGNTTGMCSRKCSLSSDGIPSWSKTNYNGCFDKEFSDLLNTINKVDVATLKDQNRIIKIASQLSTVTNTDEGLSPGNLNASVMMINRLADLRNGSTINTNATEIKSIVQATSNVLRPNNSESWKELGDVDSAVASAILFSVDVYGRSLSTLSSISKHNTEDVDSIVLEAWSFEKSNLPNQLEFPSQSDRNNIGGDKISISMESLHNSFSSENHPTLNIWGSYYRTVNEYLPGNEDFDFINSKVLSFSIDGLKMKEKLKRPVLITLQHNQEEGLKFRRTCSFWDFDRGTWDSAGCEVASTNSTHTICSCDHLTNFAILMSRNPSYDKALSIMSIVGCSISVVALILTVIVYALTWKQSKSAQATVLLNLCVALTIAYIIFMTGADKVDSKAGCKVVAVLLHYFFLAAFFMMLAEGVELLLYIIFVFHVRRTRETVMLILSAWALPLFIVAVSLGSTKVEGYGNSQACWLSVKNGLIWSFVGPALCIITVNFVILIIVLRWMSQKRSFIANNAKKRDEIRATLWNLSVTCPVLGLGWLFGVLNLISDYLVFQYLFVIINSLQGLLIFIFHALFHNKKMNERISAVYSNYISRCRKSDLSGSNQKTSSQEQPTKNTKKSGIVANAVKYYEGIAQQENSNSTGTQITSIGDSEMESKH